MDFCRLCYGEISLGTCKNIFFCQQNHPPLSELVAKFADLEINEDDPYSKNVCVVCYKKLINFHHFRQVILETNSILHQLNSCINTDSNDKTKDSVGDVFFDNKMKIENDDDIGVEAYQSTDDTGRESIENLEETSKIEIIKDLLINNDDSSTQENSTDRGNCNKSIEKVRKRRIVSESMTVCHICGKMCTMRYIDDHIRTHTGERPFKCDICGKQFVQKVNLMSHYELHSATRAYKCDHCNRTFQQSRNLRGHLKIHTGERPYSCNICGKTFAWKYSLTVHMAAHRGDKPFECRFCKKLFTRKVHLNIHLTLHGDEKPYECSFCDRKYTHKSYLLRHQAKCTKRPKE